MFIPSNDAQTDTPRDVSLLAMEQIILKLEVLKRPGLKLDPPGAKQQQVFYCIYVQGKYSYLKMF